MATISAVLKRADVSTAMGLSLVVLLSLALRAVDLLSLPTFFDEAGYVRWAVEIADQRTRAALFIPMTEDGKQPLFMWLTAGAIQIISDPMVAGRAVSALAGVASTLGIYFAGLWLGGRSVGLAAALLYAVVPFNLFFDRMALVEALLNAGGVWSLALGAYIASRAESRRHAALAGLALAVALSVALWTKMTGLFVAPYPALCALLLFRREKLLVSLTGFLVAFVAFGALTLMLFVMPGAENLVDKASSFGISPQEFLTLPVGYWTRNLQEYWVWTQAYFAAPLMWVLLAGALWAVVFRRRVAILLLLCWAVATLPPTLLAVPKLYASRYLLHGVFPLLLLTADFLVWGWEALRRRFPPEAAQQPGRQVAVALTFLLVILGPTLAFDCQLLRAPDQAPLPSGDRRLYVTGWTAGYGLMEAVWLVKERAADLTRNGQPVIVLSDDLRGTPYATLKIYMKGMPNVHYYVDMHLAHDAEGFMAAWKSHRVPILLVGNQGYDDLDAFERGVPQAKRIGLFPKPDGNSSFRVYEVSKEDLEP